MKACIFSMSGGDESDENRKPLITNLHLPCVGFSRWVLSERGIELPVRAGGYSGTRVYIIKHHKAGVTESASIVYHSCCATWATDTIFRSSRC